MNLAYQVEQAIQEVTNARESDKVTMTLDEYANEVYYYVSTIRYTETGSSDSKASRFLGKKKVIEFIKQEILKDDWATRYLKPGKEVQ
jgi:hypothetical protein